MLRSLAALFIVLGGIGGTQEVQATLFAHSLLNSGNALTVNGDIALSNSNSGWVRSDGYHIPGNTNYIADYCPNDVMCERYNDWFSFDISALQGITVSSLSFTVFTYDVYGPDHYAIFDYHRPLITLTTNHTMVGHGVYRDLGSGDLYGSGGVSLSNVFMTFSLNDQAVADLNEAIASGRTNFIIGGTTAPIPEPSTYLLLLSGVVALLALRHRQKAHID